MTPIRADLADSDISPGKYLFLLPLFIAAAFLMYIPVLNHFFVSDDFKVLFRVCTERIIFIPGFFRPLSDLTIYANYLLGGLNPLGYNAFNVLVHGTNSYFVFLICFQIGMSTREKANAFYFAILSSAFFISYPFHNEAVVWMLGRGSGMACLFALSGILCYYYLRTVNLKIWACCLCYFISMSAFESTMIFPLIMLLLLIYEKQNHITRRNWMFAFACTFCVHLILRYWLSGSILGSYGNDFFHSGFKRYIVNIAKTGGRLILPPSDNSVLLTLVFVLLIFISAIYVKKHFYHIIQKKTWRSIAMISAMLLVSTAVPIVAGVSTNTSESDRFLYFPSVFACMIWANLIVFYIRRPFIQRILVFSTIVYNLIFLELNNLNWRKASSVTSSIVEKIEGGKRSPNQGRIFFLNIPDEIEGAYVFRLGFQDALKLYGADSNRFVAVNYLSRNEMKEINKKNLPDAGKTIITVAPDIVLKKDSSGNYQIFKQEKLKYSSNREDEIYFWNSKKMEPLQSSFLRIP